MKPANGEATVCENKHWDISNKTQETEQEASKSEFSATVNRYTVFRIKRHGLAWLFSLKPCKEFARNRAADHLTPAMSG